MARSSRSNRWQARKRLDQDLLRHLCLLRGIKQDELRPDYVRHLHDPNLLPDMGIARQVIREAVKRGSHVTIFGDYDADGTPAAALLSLAFKRLGLSHEIILPTRSTGYGLRPEDISKITQRSQVLITVDTGISAVEEIKIAKAAGLEVIVLDHHLPGAVLPPADAVIDPFRADSNYPFVHLCGCALAFKLVMALCADFPNLNEAFCKWLLDLVAISTVADMMPLTGENRALVHYGIVVLRQNRRLGLQALLRHAGIEADKISASTIGFVIGPRLNASGRLGDNTPALKLLVSEDPSEAELLASEIERANTTRQSLVDETLEKAWRELFKQNNNRDRLFMLCGKDWPRGVIGLVAGRLAAEYNRPVIVGSEQDGEIRASARSTNNYSLVDGLTRSSAHLKTFGGHAQAAGLSLDIGSWSKLEQFLKNDAEKFIDVKDLKRLYVAEAILQRGDLSTKVATSIEKLEPFGLGNAKPLLILEESDISDARFIGTKSNHLKLALRSPIGEVEAIGFDMAERFKGGEIQRGSFLGYLENNYWQNNERLQLRLIDFQAEGAVIELV